MPRLTRENVQRARELIALYPQPRSALIPVLHVAQEQDGWLTQDAMEHVAELIGITPAEVYGTASFYDMLFTHPVGRYLVSICTNIACMLEGGYELLEHAEKTLGVKAGGTTADSTFTLEEVECIALCGNAPCLAVNWRFFGDVTPERFDELVSDLRGGKLADTVPPHGTLNRVRRTVGIVAGQPAAPAPPLEEGTEGGEGAPVPAPTSRRGRAEQPATKKAAKGAAKQAKQVRDKGTSAPEPGSGERE